MIQVNKIAVLLDQHGERPGPCPGRSHRIWRNLVTARDVSDQRRQVSKTYTSILLTWRYAPSEAPDDLPPISSSACSLS